ncbi:alpha/beta fold hydrolase [Ekhidna sp.]|uniref:alpha/beta hydrolase n=1 Tax=Ekhidna sp. TaxID=2608089 RepID=UPI003297821A
MKQAFLLSGKWKKIESQQMLNVLKILLLTLLGLYLVVGLLIYLLQERLIFLPEDLPSDYTYSFDASFDEHFITMADGTDLNALHFNQPQSKGLIIYFHGNAGNLARWGEVVYPFVELGYEVFIVDYRGYGKSGGNRSQKVLLSDADAVYKYASQLESEEKTILFGRSLGSAFASYLAGKNNPSKLILETPFYSLQDVAKDMMPIYPAEYLLRYNFRNYLYLNTCEVPIYIFHGTDDEVVDYSSGKQLFNSLSGKDTEFFTIEGGHHNDLSNFTSYWHYMKIVLRDE